MTTQDNKDLSRRFLEELWNQKNESIIDELLADTYVDHTPPLRSQSLGQLSPEQLKQLFEALQQDFSDIHVSIEDQIAEDDKVVTQVTWVCTLKSDDPTTAQQVTVMGVGIDRFDSGKIVENWNTLDVLYRLLILLGIDVPETPRGPVPPPPPCDDNNPCPFGFACLFGVCNRV